MNTIVSITIAILVASSSIAQAGKASYRSHSAHSHGAAQLNLAFEQNKGSLEFRTAAKSILGFEHAPKNAKQIQQIEFAKNNFTANLPMMVKFNTDLQCKFTAQKIAQEFENNKKSHSDFVAHFSVECAKPVRNSLIEFDFTSLKEIHKVEVMVLADDLQKSLEVKSKPATLELK